MTRLTSCAGNYDDGFGNNGALITVGGVGDDTANPADPLQQPGDGQEERVDDDELYDIASFTDQGDTELTITTSNPSQDDNLFLAVVQIAAQTTVGTRSATTRSTTTATTSSTSQILTARPVPSRRRRRRGQPERSACDLLRRLGRREVPSAGRRSAQLGQRGDGKGEVPVLVRSRPGRRHRTWHGAGHGSRPRQLYPVGARDGDPRLVPDAARRVYRRTITGGDTFLQFETIVLRGSALDPEQGHLTGSL